MLRIFWTIFRMMIFDILHIRKKSLWHDFFFSTIPIKSKVSSQISIKAEEISELILGFIEDIKDPQSFIEAINTADDKSSEVALQPLIVSVDKYCYFTEIRNKFLKVIAPVHEPITSMRENPSTSSLWECFKPLIPSSSRKYRTTLLYPHLLRISHL
jgi:hypothetical protein